MYKELSIFTQSRETIGNRSVLSAEQKHGGPDGGTNPPGNQRLKGAI